MCRGPESNWRHQHFQCCALPTELPRLVPSREYILLLTINSVKEFERPTLFDSPPSLSLMVLGGPTNDPNLLPTRWCTIIDQLREAIFLVVK